VSNRSKTQKPSFFSRAVAGLVLFALAAACDSPPGPTPNPPENAGRNRLEIAGATTVAPQQTAEVQAFLVTASGAREDVTARVTWTTSDSAVLSVSSGARVTGGAVGEATLRATLRASLNDLSASASVIVVPAGTFRLAGIVRSRGSTSPVAGAQVQLITTSGDVLTTQTAGSAGFRFYGVAGHARLRISRRAFHPYEAEIDIHDHLTHDVSLSDFSGSYTLVLSASSSCRLQLPEDLRTRTYSAEIAQVDDSLTVTLQYPSPLSWGQPNMFTGWFDTSNNVIFQLGAEEWWLDGGAEFHAHGRMTGTIVGEGLSGFLDGEMEAIVSNEGGRGNRRITCTAPDHGVVFSR
jgi:hypothetical protein